VGLREVVSSIALRFVRTQPSRGERARGIDRWAKTLGGVIFNPDKLQADKGSGIYRTMVREEEVIKAALLLKKMVVLSPGWEVRPASDDGVDMQAKDLMDYAFDHMDGNVEGMLMAQMDALDIGHSVQEINAMFYERGPFAGKAGIKSVKSKPGETFKYELDDFGNLKPDGLRQFDKMNLGGKGEPMPIDKFMLWAYQGTPSNPYGISDLQPAYRSYFAKKLITAFWSIHLEKFASPTPVGKHRPGADQGEKDDVLSFLKNLHHNNALVVPEDWEVEFLERTRQGRAEYNEAVQYHNLMMARAILLPSLVLDTQTRGAHVTASKQFEAFLLVCQWVQQALEDVVNDQLISRIVDWNLDVIEYPRFAFKPFPNENLGDIMKAFQMGVQAKIVNPKETFLREMLGWPEPEEDLEEDPEPTPTVPPQSQPRPTNGGGIREEPKGTPDEEEVRARRMLDKIITLVGQEAKGGSILDPPNPEFPPSIGGGFGGVPPTGDALGAERVAEIETIAQVTIQSMLFLRNEFSTPDFVLGWLQSNDVRSDVDVALLQQDRRFWVVVLRSSTEFIPNTLERVKVDKGVVALVGKPREQGFSSNVQIYQERLRTLPARGLSPVERKVAFPALARQWDSEEEKWTMRLGEVIKVQQREFLADLGARGFLDKSSNTGIQALKLPRVQRFRSTINEMLATAVFLGAIQARKEIERALGQRLTLKRVTGINFAELPAGHASVAREFGKKVPIPTDLLVQYNRASFTIAGELSEDLLTKAKGILDRAIRRGTPRRVVEQQLADLFRRYIPSSADELLRADRLANIVRTNFSEAFNTGRNNFFHDPDVWVHIEAFSYSAVMDDRTTDICESWQGTTVRKDDPRYAEMNPPNHYQCRSVWVPVTVKEKFRATDRNKVTRLPSPAAGFEN
jgi:SPP1 gp7 family putative phage head morphogenesis protein